MTAGRGVTRKGCAVWLAFAVAACSAGCTIDSAPAVPEGFAFTGDPKTIDNPPAQRSGPGDAGNSDRALGEIVDPAGLWAIKARIGLIAKVPLFGEQQAGSIEYSLLRITRLTNRHRFEMSPCETITDKVAGNETIIPRSLHEVVGPRIGEGEVFTVEREGASFVMPPLYELWGVKGLTDPLNDPMPAASDDARIYDQDGDGKPGVTLITKGLIPGEIYMVQRLVDRFAGVIVDADHLAGQVTPRRDKFIVGASKDALANNVPTYVDNSPDQNWFQMTRVAEGSDCDTLLAHTEDLFTGP